MKYQLDKARILLPSIFILLGQSVATAHAQENVEFFDDFSKDSISYLTDDRPDDRSVRSYVITPGGIEMRASATGDDRGQAEIRIANHRTDTVRARLSLSSESDIPTDSDGDVRLRIAGTWYNDIQDGGLGDGDQTGDVYIQARLRLRSEGRREFSLCLSSTLADGGSQDVPIFDGNTCKVMPDFELELDKVYEAHVSLDREANTIAFGIDGREILTDIGQPVYLPAYYQKRIQVSHEGASGQAVGMVYGIGTGGDLQDFSVSPLSSGPYLVDLQGDSVNLTVNQGRARFEAIAPADDSERVSLRVIGSSNRIEGKMELSSESVVADGEDSFALMRLGGTFYNDTAEGGFNEDEGNVFAGIYLRALSGGVRVLEYCLYRSTTVDFSDGIELISQDGTDCGDFGITPELDTTYSASIITDLDAGTVTYNVDGTERVHTIATATYTPDLTRQFISAQARASAGSTAIGYLDDYRTSVDAPLVAATNSGGSSSEDSSGSGGCSIAGGRGATDWSLPIMALIALFACLRRRTSRAWLQTVSSRYPK